VGRLIAIIKIILLILDAVKDGVITIDEIKRILQAILDMLGGASAQSEI